MTVKNRAGLISNLQAALKKHFKPAPPAPGRPLMEHVLYAALLEESPVDLADEAYAKCEQEFFDWNEVRVTSVTELAEVLAHLPAPMSTARRLKKCLQGLFETFYSFEIDHLKKENLGKAVAKFETMNGVTPFVLASVVQHGLGGHAIPVNSAAMRIMLISGIVSDAEARSGKVPGLERAVPKNKAIDFSSQLHQAGVALAADPLDPIVHEVILAVDKDATLPTAESEARRKAARRSARKAAAAKAAAPKAAPPAKAAAGKSSAAKSSAAKSSVAKSPATKSTTAKATAAKPSAAEAANATDTATTGKSAGGKAAKATVKPAASDAKPTTKPASAKKPVSKKAAADKTASTKATAANPKANDKPEANAASKKPSKKSAKKTAEKSTSSKPKASDKSADPASPESPTDQPADSPIDATAMDATAEDSTAVDSTAVGGNQKLTKRKPR